MLGQLLWIELDPYRHSLHDLDPVAAGVLRRQQRERAARAHAAARARSVVRHVAAVQVAMHLDRLADSPLLPLGFLELCLPPHLFSRTPHHPLRSRLTAL